MRQGNLGHGIAAAWTLSAGGLSPDHILGSHHFSWVFLRFFLGFFICFYFFYIYSFSLKYLRFAHNSPIDLGSLTLNRNPPPPFSSPHSSSHSPPRLFLYFHHLRPSSLPFCALGPSSLIAFSHFAYMPRTYSVWCYFLRSYFKPGRPSHRPSVPTPTRPPAWCKTPSGL